MAYLLKIDDGEENSRYVYIKKTEHLVTLVSNSADKDKPFCPFCNGKILIKEFSSHVSTCYKLAKDGTLVKLLEEPNGVNTREDEHMEVARDALTRKMEFKSYKNKLERRCIVYAYMESSLCQVCDEEAPETDVSESITEAEGVILGTGKRLSLHKVNSVCRYIVLLRQLQE